MRFFLVDADPERAPQLEASLRHTGIAEDIVVLSGARDLVEFLLAEGKERRGAAPSPSILLLRLGRPEADGLHILEELKSGEKTRYIPVIVLTDGGDEGRARTCYNLGCNLFIILPEDRLKLDEMVRKLGAFLKVIALPIPF